MKNGCGQDGIRFALRKTLVQVFECPGAARRDDRKAYRFRYGRRERKIVAFFGPIPIHAGQ